MTTSRRLNAFYLPLTRTKSENHGDDFGSVFDVHFHQFDAKVDHLKAKASSNIVVRHQLLFTASASVHSWRRYEPCTGLARWLAGGRGGGDVQQRTECVRLCVCRRGRMVNACGQSTTNNNERGRAEGPSISFFSPPGPIYDIRLADDGSPSR